MDRKARCGVHLWGLHLSRSFVTICVEQYWCRNHEERGLASEAPKELRSRVKRLLTGEKNEIDAHELFIWLRDRANDTDFSLVRDVGDFCAHRHERHKGVSWHRGNDFCDMMLSVNARLENKPPLEPFKLGLRARARLVPPFVVSLMGFERKAFIELAYRSIAKIAKYDEDRVVMIEGSGDEETGMVNCLLTLPRTPEPILQNHLMWQTFNIMVETGLIEREMVNEFEGAAEYLTVFAMTRMHLVKIKNAAANCFLSMGTSSTMVNRLIVSIFVDGPSQFSSVTTIFMSTCDVRDWCDPLLQPTFVQPGFLSRPNWQAALDFSSSKLVPFDLEDFRSQRHAITQAKPEPAVVFLPSVDLNGPASQFYNFTPPPSR